MSPEVIACGRCRTVRTENEWSALRRVAQMDAERLSGVVVRWPDDVIVVVRECLCGTPIARLAPRGANEAHGMGSSNETQ
jgi:hypothetical protein